MLGIEGEDKSRSRSSRGADLSAGAALGAKAGVRSARWLPPRSRPPNMPLDAGRWGMGVSCGEIDCVRAREFCCHVGWFQFERAPRKPAEESVREGENEFTSVERFNPPFCHEGDVDVSRKLVLCSDCERSWLRSELLAHDEVPMALARRAQ